MKILDIHLITLPRSDYFSYEALFLIMDHWKNRGVCRQDWPLTSETLVSAKTFIIMHKYMVRCEFNGRKWTRTSHLNSLEKPKSQSFFATSFLTYPCLYFVCWEWAKLKMKSFSEQWNMRSCSPQGISHTRMHTNRVSAQYLIWQTGAE